MHWIRHGMALCLKLALSKMAAGLFDEVLPLKMVAVVAMRVWDLLGRKNNQ